MKIIGVTICGIAGGLAGYFGGLVAVICVVLGQLGIIVLSKINH